MDGELKNFPPSEHKLKRLREQGIVPRSRELTLFANIVGLLLALLFVRAAVINGDFTAAVRGAWSGSAPAGIEAAEHWRHTALTLGLLLLLPVGASALLIGAYQTGFLIAGHLVQLNLGKIFDFSSRFGLRGRTAIGAVLRAGGWAAAAWLLLRKVFEWVTLVDQGELRVPRTGSDIFSDLIKPVLEQGGGEIGTVLLSLAGFTFLLGIVSRFGAVMAFRAEHSMSRGEMEAENRELESSPELRRKIGELREQ